MSIVLTDITVAQTSLSWVRSVDPLADSITVTGSRIDPPSIEGGRLPQLLHNEVQAFGSLSISTSHSVLGKTRRLASTAKTSSTKVK